MASQADILIHCPHCQARYRLPVSSAGHRARCARCRQTFRIEAQPPRFQPPTEDDILRWLCEGTEDYDFPRRPPPPPRKVHHPDNRPADPASPPGGPRDSELREDSYTSNPGSCCSLAE